MGTWRDQWTRQQKSLEVALAHAVIKTRIKELTSGDEAVAWSAYLELVRLTGMDFIFDPNEPKTGQKVWRSWYSKQKKKLVWDETKRTFAAE